jgi:hypothetical protein
VAIQSTAGRRPSDGASEAMLFKPLPVFQALCTNIAASVFVVLRESARGLSSFARAQRRAGHHEVVAAATPECGCLSFKFRTPNFAFRTPCSSAPSRSRLAITTSSAHPFIPQSALPIPH